MRTLRQRWLGLLGLVVAGLLAIALPASSDVGGDCTFEGTRLYGKVEKVSSFGDVKVKFVSSFPDLKVKYVSSFADSCGEWQMVDSFADFTIQEVSSFPDIKVKVVTSFPGLP